MELRQNIYHHRRKIRPITWLIIGIILFIGFGITFVNTALTPAKDAEVKYATIAKNKGLKKQTDFLVSKRAHTYYSVFGKDKNNAKIAFIMKASKNDKNIKPIKIYLKKGLSYQQTVNLVWAKYNPKKVYSLGLTMYKGVPAWDISFKTKKNSLSFVTIQFSNGKELKLIKNL